MEGRGGGEAQRVADPPPKKKVKEIWHIPVLQGRPEQSVADEREDAAGEGRPLQQRA
jgi:hypothetical protein